jgi:hypothetical protein
MSKITELASSTINGTDSVTVELVEADETPAAVIIKWPSRRPCAFRGASLTPLPWLCGCSARPTLRWPQSSRGGRCEQPQPSPRRRRPATSVRVSDARALFSVDRSSELSHGSSLANLLMPPAVAADTAVQVGGVSAVL